MIKKIFFHTSFMIAGYCMLAMMSDVFAFQKLHIDRKDGYNLQVIEVVLDGEHQVITSVALTGGDTLANLKNKVSGISALNGAFFCPKDYDYCDDTSTVSERIFNGHAQSYSKYWPDTGARVIFGFDKEAKPFVAQNNHGYVEGFDLNINKDKMDEFMFGLGNRPALLINGQDMIWGAEVHLDAKLKSVRTNAFICSTKDRQKIYFGYVNSITIFQMPEFLKKHFDCYNALNLDAGGSMAMIYDHNSIKKPGRKIMDAVVVVDRDTYERLTYTSLPPAEKYEDDSYQLTPEDERLVSRMVESLSRAQNRIHPKRRNRFIRKINSQLYLGFETSAAQTNPRVKKLLQELIYRRLVETPW